ncbi:MAG: hypothetical protein HYU71_15710 [Bacteroidetes bacterium]|nr:hypothetical protein [Bacteroidota bacterium]
MLEIVKTLMEMPEKLGALLIKVAKMVFTIILAANIYELCVGKYRYFNWTDTAAWLEFVMSGRILLCIAFYGIAWAILFQVLPIISFLPLKYLAHKYPPSLTIDKSTSSGILKLLDSFKLLKVDFKGRRVTAAMYTEELRNFVEEYSKKETRSEIISIKNALITDVWHFYFLFVVSYFIYLRPMVHTGWITFLILFGCIILPYFYICISAILDKLHESSQEILWQLNNILSEKRIMEALKELGLFTYDYPLGENARTIYAVTIKGKEHLLYNHFSKSDLSEHEIRHCCQLIEKENKPLIFITSASLKEADQKLLTENEGQLQVISFSNNDQLSSLLKTSLAL